MRPKLNPRQAALQSGLMSDAWWRNIEHGYETRNGQRLPIHPTKDKLIGMADFLGIDRAELLTLAGYEVLPGDLERSPPPESEMERRIQDLQGVTEQEKQDMLAEWRTSLLMQQRLMARLGRYASGGRA